MNVARKNNELAWHIGMTSSAASFGPNARSSAVVSDNVALAAWLRMAPLGRPVVPEVYISAQGSSGRTGTPGSASLARSISASYDDQPPGAVSAAKWTNRADG